MKIYYSNLGGVNFEKGEIPLVGVLESFYGLKNIEMPIWADSYFLDSGAFSAWRKKENIDINSYMTFIIRNKEKLDIYAALDVIGNGQESYKNFRIMKKNNLNALPTFHFGVDKKYLFLYTEKTDYIALGGIAKRNKKERIAFLNTVFSLFPDFKFHGFGIMDEEILLNYPWCSVDASSLHLIARYGGVYTPWGSKKINPNVQHKDKKWRTLNKENKVKEYIKEIGFDFNKAQLQDSEGIKERCKISIYYFENLIKKKNNKFKKSNNLIGELYGNK